MPVAIVVGVQWGDEGKGKVVDYLTEAADLVVRFQGGNNAGHTVVVDGEKTALRLVPSGILHPNTRCLLAAGVVVNPFSILEEFDQLAAVGNHVTPERFGIAAECQLILPYHMAIDAAREEVRAKSKLGTTGKGIGPAYEQLVNRSGIRMIDLCHDDYLDTLLDRNVEHANAYLEGVVNSPTKFDAAEIRAQLEPAAERLRPYITNVSLEVDRAVRAKKQVVFEGAQGSLLDIIHGTYPFVTSSNTAAGYACASAGMGPQHVDMVVGICKAYCTRVGSGPFPTEDEGSAGEVLRVAGVEFGTVTGRPRRCGWFDGMAVRRSNRLNGADRMIITKLDVLTGFETVKVGVAYKLDGERLDDVPASWLDVERLEVEYEELAGWPEDITAVRAFKDLPVNAQNLLKRIEEVADCRVSGFSVGPDRVQTIITDPDLMKLANR